MDIDLHDITLSVNGKKYQRRVESRLLPMSAASTASAAPAPSCSMASRCAPA
jgi:hypothetical protein